MPSSLVSPATARRLNRSRILRTLYASGPMARVDLASAMGTTRAAIGQIVQPLLDKSVLEERDPRPSAILGGRRARPLWFAPNGWTTAAVQLLPGLVRAATVTATGKVLDTAERPLDDGAGDGGGDPSEVVDAIVDAVRQACSAAGSVKGLGIAVPGMVDTGDGRVVAINLMPGLAGVPLARLVSGRLVSERPVSEGPGLATFLDQHPRAQALGDLLFGPGRGVDSFVSLYTGEALGAGLILHGSLHRGPGGAGGEVGHSLVDVSGRRCHCGQRGCWETIATVGWLRDRAIALGLESRPGAMTAGSVAAAARDGDPRAERLIDEYARNLAYGIANLHQLLAPELFVVHGDVVAGGERLRAAVERHAAALVPAHPSIAPTIVLAPSDDEATLRGAASIALFQTLELDP